MLAIHKALSPEGITRRISYRCTYRASPVSYDETMFHIVIHDTIFCRVCQDPFC